MVLIADLADRGENPAESPYDCRLEVDTEERKAIIVWNESLRFHAELALSDEARFPAMHSNPWATLTTPDGYLTAESADKLAAELERLSGAKVYVVDAYDDEPSVGFEVVTEYRDGETYEAWLDRIGWPVIATLINSTDPGTFNYPYLFSAILYR